MLLPTLLLPLLVDAAHAGCIVDTDRAARQASAPLVVTGTIVGIEVVGEGEAAVVLERLRVDHTYKGAVVTGELLLRTQPPSHSGCGAPPVFGIGAEVYAIVAPVEGQALPLSGCRGDIGLVQYLDGGVATLADIAAEAPATARTFAGAPPAPPPREPILAPFPKGTDEWVRTVVAGVAHDGLLARADPDEVVAIFRVEGLDVVETLGRSELAPVVTRATPLAPGSGLRWRPGTAVGPVRAVESDGAVVARGTVPAAVVGDLWVPVARRDDGERLVVHGEVGLSSRPGAAAVATIGSLDDASLFADGPPVGEWRPVHVEAPWIAGRAWVRVEQVGPFPSPGSGVFGLMGSSSSAITLALPAGAEVRDPLDGSVFARAPYGEWVPWLATGEGRAWVVIETLHGARVGEVTCEASLARPTRCDAR